MSTKKTKVNDLSVAHEGTQIVLPIVDGKPMSYDEAIEWMKRKKAEDEQETAIHHQMDCSPLDGAVAFHRALSQKYGWTQMVPTPGFFADRPPTMVGVPLSATETLQVPLGRIEIPGIEGFLETGIGTHPTPYFSINGKVKRKHASQVADIVKLTRKFLKEQSIYKGKAVKLSFAYIEREEEGGMGYHPINDAPQFLDLAGITDDDLIFGEKTLNDITIGLFTPIEQTDACRAFSVPLKRGVLLYGPYGTGKTMTAYVSALKAVRNGWTFVYLDSVADLKQGLEFAAKYAPCVLFAEDIDRVINGERSLSMDEVLNTLDGVDTKGAEIITVFTTNHVEQINPAMLRMGRLDTLVEVSPPDAKAVERLVRLYARGLLDEKASLSKIGKALEGKIPAFVREVVERAKLAAIARTAGGNIKGHVIEEDLLNAAKAMEPHEAMLKPREQKEEMPEVLVRIPQNHKGAKAILHSVKQAG